MANPGVTYVVDGVRIRVKLYAGDENEILLAPISDNNAIDNAAGEIIRIVDSDSPDTPEALQYLKQKKNIRDEIEPVGFECNDKISCRSRLRSGEDLKCSIKKIKVCDEGVSDSDE